MFTPVMQKKKKKYSPFGTNALSEKNKKRENKEKWYCLTPKEIDKFFEVEIYRGTTVSFKTIINGD
jgi:hypothetical protein